MNYGKMNYMGSTEIHPTTFSYQFGTAAADSRPLSDIEQAEREAWWEANCGADADLEDSVILALRALRAVLDQLGAGKDEK